MQRLILLLIIFCSFQTMWCSEINIDELKKEVNSFNGTNQHEKSILLLEEIISDPKSTNYDLYHAYFLKYLTYKGLFNYVSAQSNLDLALKAGLKTKHKKQVEAQILLETLFVNFDLQYYDKVDTLITTITDADLALVDKQTHAFYLSILGTLAIRAKQYDEGSDYLNQAKAILLKSAPQHLPLIYRKEIGMYGILRDNEKVVKSFRMGLYYADKYNLDIYRLAMYNDISHYYSEVGDFKNSAIAREAIYDLSTRINSINVNGELSLLEKKLTEERFRKIEERSKQKLFLIIGFLVIILAVGSYLFWYFRNKSKNKLEFSHQSIDVKNNVVINEKQQHLLTSLTDRQLEIALLVREGKKNKEIADKLFISENTVKYHLKIIYDVLGISNRNEL